MARFSSSAVSDRVTAARAWWLRTKEHRSARIGLRITKWVAIVMSVLWAVYIVAGNILLNSQFAKSKANANPQTMQIDYASAWTIIPGAIHANGVSAYGQFTGLQYHATVEALSVRVSMFSLFGHHPVISNVTVSGLVLEGRSMPAGAPGAPTISAPVPLEPLHAPPNPIVDESMSSWTLTLNSLDVDGSDFWVDAVRYVGPMELHGALVVTPNRGLTANTFFVSLDGGFVVVDSLPAAPLLAGWVELHLDETDPRKPVNSGTLGNLTIKVIMAGQIADLGFSNHLGAAMPTPIQGRGGKFAINLALDHGQVAAPGGLQLWIDGAWTELAGMGMGARLDLDCAVQDSAEGPTARVATRVEFAEVTNPKRELLASIPMAIFRASATQLDLSKIDHVNVTYDARVPRASIPDATRVNALTKSDAVQIKHGSLIATANLEGSIPSGSLKGHATLASDPIQAIVQGTSVQGKLAATLLFNRATSQDDIAITGTTMRLDNVALDKDASHTRDWWTTLAIPRGRLRVSGSPMFLGNIHMEFRDIDPAITALSSLHGLPAWLHGLMGLGPYLADASGKFGEKTKLESLDVRTRAEGVVTHPPVHIRAQYDNTKNPDHLRTAVEFGDLKVGVDKTGSALDIRLFDVDEWYTSGTGARAAGGTSK